MRQGQRTGIGWAWEFQYPDGSWQLCNWSEPFKERLLGDDCSKPADEPEHIRKWFDGPQTDGDTLND